MTTTEKALAQVEALTIERYGFGAAVSVDENTSRCFVRCWDKKGLMVNEVERRFRAAAIKAMLADLLLAVANAPPTVTDEEDE